LQESQGIDGLDVFIAAAAFAFARDGGLLMQLRDIGEGKPQGLGLCCATGGGRLTVGYVVRCRREVEVHGY